MTWKKILLEGDAAELSDVASVNVDHAVASAGVAALASRQDHKHDVDEGVVGTLGAVDGGAAALGTDNAIPHLDHKHALGPLVAALDFAQNMADGMVLEAVDTPPDAAAEVEGQIYFDSGVADKHPYIWVP